MTTEPTKTVDTALVIERAYIDWNQIDKPEDYVPGMSFGQFAVKRMAKDLTGGEVAAGTSSEVSRADNIHHLPVSRTMEPYSAGPVPEPESGPFEAWGRTVTGADIEVLAAEAETGYDVSRFGRGRDPIYLVLRINPMIHPSQAGPDQAFQAIRGALERLSLTDDVRVGVVPFHPSGTQIVARPEYDILHALWAQVLSRRVATEEAPSSE